MPCEDDDEDNCDFGSGDGLETSVFSPAGPDSKCPPHHHHYQPPQQFIVCFSSWSVSGQAAQPETEHCHRINLPLVDCVQHCTERTAYNVLYRMNNSSSGCKFVIKGVGLAHWQTRHGFLYGFHKPQPFRSQTRIFLFYFYPVTLHVLFSLFYFFVPPPCLFYILYIIVLACLANFLLLYVC